MDAKELNELGKCMTELENLFGGEQSPFGLIYRTGIKKVVLHNQGKYYDIERVTEFVMSSHPKAMEEGLRVLELVDEINEGMERYLRENGSMPPGTLVQ
jgi:hypothetical protein